MTGQDKDPLSYTLIPLSSNEPLFEWDIVTDALYMSQGLVKSLNLGQAPETMSDFYKLLAVDAATELSAARRGILLDQAGSSPECSYLCNGFWVQEYLLVLSRNSEGHATRVMGRMAASPVSPSHAGVGFNTGVQDQSASGVWIYEVKSGKIWHDQACDNILGRSGARRYPITIGESILEVHPAERNSLKRHYQIFCEGTFFGDCITDFVRVKMADDTYAPILLRASAVERNEAGKAVLIAGMISLGEPAILANANIFKDDTLFHALNNMGGGQWNLDTRSGMIYFCPRFMEFLGRDPEGRPLTIGDWNKLVHPEDQEKISDALQRIIESPDNGDTFEVTYRMREASGNWAWIFDRGYVTWRDRTGRAGHLIGSVTNITTSQAERNKLEDLVRHDTLTGLRSRAFCNLEIEHIEQNGIRPVCVISLDITGLKMVNDSMGHAMGDEMLIKAATLLRECLRKSDCVGRVGGDEFMALLPNCGLQQGRKLVAYIRECFARYNETPGVMPVYAASGLACGKSVNESLPEIIARADEAMYADKKAQRKFAHASLRSWIVRKTGKEPVPDNRG